MKPTHEMFPPAFFFSFSLHFSSAVTKSTWLLTYRLVVKFFMNNTIEVCVCVCLSIWQTARMRMSCWVVEFRAVIWFLIVSSALRVVYLHIKWYKSNKNQNRSQLLLRIVYIEALVHRSHFKCVLINSLKCHSEVRKMNGNALPIRSSGETPTTLLCVLIPMKMMTQEYWWLHFTIGCYF